MNRRTITITALAAATAAEAGLVRLGRTYGSTAAERHRVLPGDDLITAPDVVTNHATTIEAPPEAVWPWLAQVGWGRGGWYTARWVDQLLFPANGPSADEILPEFQEIHVGMFIPDGPPRTGCGLTVAAVEPERSLVLRSNSHLPASWRDRARVDWTWSFDLRAVGDGRTRFLLRSRWTTTPWWLTAGGRLVVVPADFLMARDLLRGVRQRAEHLHRTQVLEADVAMAIP